MSASQSLQKPSQGGAKTIFSVTSGNFLEMYDFMVFGYYATAITTATRSDPEKDRRVRDHIPADRWGEPYDLMGMIVFLASPASNYVCGQVLTVDGGYLVR